MSKKQPLVLPPVHLSVCVSIMIRPVSSPTSKTGYTKPIYLEWCKRVAFSYIALFFIIISEIIISLKGDRGVSIVCAEFEKC